MATRKLKFVPGEKLGMTLKRESCVVAVVKEGGAFHREGVERGWTIVKVDGSKVDTDNIREVLKEAMGSGKKEFKIKFEVAEQLNRRITFKPGEKLGFWLVEDTCILERVREDAAGAAAGVKPGWTILKVNKTSVSPTTVKDALKRCARLRKEFAIVFEICPPKKSLMNKILGSKASTKENNIKPVENVKQRNRCNTVPLKQARSKVNSAPPNLSPNIPRKASAFQKLGLVFSKSNENVDEKQQKSPNVSKTTDKLRIELKALKDENEDYKRRNKNLEVSVLSASESIGKHQDTYNLLKEKKAEVVKLKNEVTRLKRQNKDLELANKSLEATLAANSSLRKEIEDMKKSHQDVLAAKAAELEELRNRNSKLKTDRATLRELLNETLKKKHHQEKKEKSLSPPPPALPPRLQVSRSSTLPRRRSDPSDDYSSAPKRSPPISPSLIAGNDTIRVNPLPKISVHEAENTALKREVKALRESLRDFESEHREQEATSKEKSSKGKQDTVASNELQRTIRKLLLVQEEISRAVESGDLSKAKYIIKRNKGFRNIG